MLKELELIAEIHRRAFEFVALNPATERGFSLVGDRIKLHASEETVVVIVGGVEAYCWTELITGNPPEPPTIALRYKLLLIKEALDALRKRMLLDDIARNAALPFPEETPNYPPEGDVSDDAELAMRATKVVLAEGKRAHQHTDGTWTCKVWSLGPAPVIWVNCWQGGSVEIMLGGEDGDFICAYGSMMHNHKPDKMKIVLERLRKYMLLSDIAGV